MDDEREGSSVIVTMALTKDTEDELTVRYVDRETGRRPLVAGGLVLSKSALPGPPPPLISVTLRWEPVAASSTESHTAVRPLSTETVSSWQANVKPGDRLTVIKSRGAGVKSPPEWLKQYVGKTGTVLWTTADGAMLDIDGSASWFSYQELKPGA